jgi:DNA polymerase III subunit gamma/tau
MAYQVLARKWRPQNFSSLVGQGPIVTALRNALREGRIAQAYLFSGIRGVGKTTAARVLAKALNCQRGPGADPCNECPPCLEITRGSDLDVIEVDAATYSKVEQVRELTESLRYGPARDRYKVVVLDEVHRLSRQAFDALLKIVEEPPPHLVFIFATTEIEAVPATILSRCQEFHFRRVPSVEVAGLLREICAAEAITASEAALRLIARAGEGSVRDAVALLDQLATFGSGAIADEDAVRLLGGLDTALFARLLGAILAGDPPEVVAVVARIEEAGWDPRHVYGQFLAFCRDALRLGMGGAGQAAAQVDLPSEEAAALAEVARRAGYENLLRLLQQLLASEATVRRSETGTLAVEIAWLRAAELPKLTRVEEILSGHAGSGAGGGAGTASGAAGGGGRPVAAEPRRPAAPPREAAAVRPAVTATAATTEPAPQTVSAAAPFAPAAPAVVASPPPVRLVPPAGLELPARPERSERPERPERPEPATPADALRAFLEEVGRLKAPLAALLEEAEDRRFADGCLQIVLAPGDRMLRARLERDNNRQVLEQALARAWGDGTRWELVEGVGRPPAPAPEIGAVKLELVAENPTIQTILDIFGGTVEKVEEHGSQ